MSYQQYGLALDSLAKPFTLLRRTEGMMRLERKALLLFDLPEAGTYPENVSRSATMIDELAESVPIWLVWAVTDNGGAILRGVCLTEATARRYKARLEAQHRPLWVARFELEASFANHLYAGAFAPSR